ncbi:MAG: bifunctional DNA-formamidopyrimidine glycosylase/DNA-(apurinic or apyrimidinic site) lyase [candidate division Zixibacteria bacterium]|nr:bifunctional DNA-formamidopyrimidine glycosylase/DNA-(apurinic or apyrimidinic site) lyase [Candidatus Tariuqbacter arcticus]
MPELPEVETIVRQLRPLIRGEIIRACIIFQPSYLRGGDPAEFIDAVIGREVGSVNRRGKYILWQLDIGIVLSHLGMTGKYIIRDAGSEVPKHSVASFGFDGFNLILDDTRRFGRLRLYPVLNGIPEIESLGIEPLSESFTPEYLTGKFKGRKRSIKELILDQSIIAGLGNIYASEILFQARIHPLKPGGEISLEQLNELISSTKEILTQAIEKSGATISDYKRVDEKSGEFQNFLKVYGKTAVACPSCDSEIERIVIGGRSSFFCPKCQNHL